MQLDVPNDFVLRTLGQVVLENAWLQRQLQIAQAAIVSLSSKDAQRAAEISGNHEAESVPASVPAPQNPG